MVITDITYPQMTNFIYMTVNSQSCAEALVFHDNCLFKLGLNILVEKSAFTLSKSRNQCLIQRGGRDEYR